jgi:hypothetical protein
VCYCYFSAVPVEMEKRLMAVLTLALKVVVVLEALDFVLLQIPLNGEYLIHFLPLDVVLFAKLLVLQFVMLQLALTVENVRG